MMDRHRWNAWLALCRRYFYVWQAAWQQRASFNSSLLHEQEADFLPAALALQEKPVSPTARRTATLLVALLACALLWSFFGHIDIVVNATGKIIPTGRTKMIAAIEVASVKALHVAEGQHVKAGQVLVELDSGMSDAEQDKAKADHAAAVLEAARSQALIDALDAGTFPRMPSTAALGARAVQISAADWNAEEMHLSGQYRDYLARRARADAEIAHLTEALKLAAKRAADYQALLSDHDVSQQAWMEREQARQSVESQLSEARQQKLALFEETRRIAYDQLGEGNKLAASSLQDVQRAATHSRLLKLLAPVDGTVQQLQVYTVGGVVPPAQELMQIVPDEQVVEVEAQLDNKDIGFVHTGQIAEVKVQAFDYTKFGTLAAHVTHIAHDAVPNDRKVLSYSVMVSLRDVALDIDGRRVELTPGMAVDVGIKTGERRIIEYLLSPLLHHQRESLHER